MFYILLLFFFLGQPFIYSHRQTPEPPLVPGQQCPNFLLKIAPQASQMWLRLLMFVAFCVAGLINNFVWNSNNNTMTHIHNQVTKVMSSSMYKKNITIRHYNKKQTSNHLDSSLNGFTYTGKPFRGCQNGNDWPIQRDAVQNSPSLLHFLFLAVLLCQAQPSIWSAISHWGLIA